jgi:hypothetical protein
MPSMYSIVLLSVAATASACTRAGLLDVRTRLLDQAVQSSLAAAPVPFSDFASTFKITQNNEILNFTDQTALGNTTSFASNFNITAVDTATCQFATLILPSERVRGSSNAKTQTAIFSIRVKTNYNHKIVELEALNALPGSHQLFNTEAFPKQTPKVWTSPASTSDKKYSRDDLVKGGIAYVDNMQVGKNEDALIAYECPRNENGVQTTPHCGAGMDLFMWPVTDRRWVVDDVTGVVLGIFFFHYKDGKGKMNQMGIRSSNSSTGLWLHEYFKMLDGKIVQVEAAMQTLPASYKDVWALQS